VLRVGHDPRFVDAYLPAAVTKAGNWSAAVAGRAHLTIADGLMEVFVNLSRPVVWLGAGLLWVCTVLAGATPAFAQTGPGAAPDTVTGAWQAPTLTITRYDEHWTEFADPELRDQHWTGKFKYIPLGSETYLTTGIELRARNENYRDNQWGAGPAPNDSYLWLRTMPYADLHIGSGAFGIRSFVQPIAAYAIGVKPSAGPIDETRADLLQGFVDVRLGTAETGSTTGTGITLRAGRQMISLGTERLIGTRYGPNVPLSFQGLRSLVSLGGTITTLLAVRPVDPGLHNFDDSASRTKSLWSAYTTIPNIGAGSSFDVYYIGYRNKSAMFLGRKGSELRHSLGARVFGSRDNWKWDVEGVVQFGRFAEDRIRAWTLAAEITRTFPKAQLAPHVVLRVSVVSGDKRSGDHRLGTFNAMFPKGKYFGELSPVGPTNIVSANPLLAFSLGRNVAASIAGMAYWRYSLGDGVYDVPGNLIRSPGKATARFIGKEAEGMVAWQATPELELSTSLSAFAPGNFIRQTGVAKTIVMLGVESNFRF